MNHPQRVGKTVGDLTVSKQLVPGDRFPQLKLNIADGDSITLPVDIETDYAVVLFYRGHW